MTRIMVSVIVPVYNASPWLARCLDSLLGQTLKDIEIIYVDDASSDNSLEILREYEKKDLRLKVIAREKNGGAAAARNCGMAAAAGEYVGFVDADDYVDLDFYDKLYTAAKQENADIAKGEAFMVTTDGGKYKWGPQFDDISKNKIDFIFAFSLAIYRRDFLQQHRVDFPAEFCVYEDQIFLTKAVCFANKIALVEGTFYHYIRQKNSLDSEKWGLEKLKSQVAGRNVLMDFINEHVRDGETYNLFFKKEFHWLLYFLLFRNDTFDGRLAVIRGAIGIWDKCAFKDEYTKEADEEHVRWLTDGDEVKLFYHLALQEERNNEFRDFEARIMADIKRAMFPNLMQRLTLLLASPILKLSLPREQYAVFKNTPDCFLAAAGRYPVKRLRKIVRFFGPIPPSRKPPGGSEALDD
jgi:glycosyltransferase involved in cell wall biosynthesis